MASRMEFCLESGRAGLSQLRTSGRYESLVERESPRAAVSRLLESADRGYLIIVGEPGIGKTAFLLGLCSGQTIPFFFRECSLSARPVNFLNYLAAELHLKAGGDGPPPVWIDDPLEAHSRVNLLLGQIGSTLTKKQRPLILIDALDEADLPSSGDARLLKFELPPGGYVICTTRPAPGVIDLLRCLPDVQEFKWQKDKRTVSEVDDYIEGSLGGKTESSPRREIAAAADGNFLIASHYVRVCQKGELCQGDGIPKSHKLEAMYEDEWDRRVLTRAGSRDLCEDIATLFAAAREPLSVSVIAAAISHMRDTKVKGRELQHSLSDIEMFFDSFQHGTSTLWHPFHRSFGRWLEDNYGADLGEAQRALALSFLGIANDPRNPDFECAARNICWHLRQWGTTAKDGVQRAQARDHLRDAVDDPVFREEVEQRLGTDVYSERLLRQALKHAEESSSLPDIVRFGTRYVGYRQLAGASVRRLATYLDSNRASEALKVAEILAPRSESLACYGIVATWAADNHRTDVVCEALERISERRPESFGVFVPVAWALLLYLAKTGETEQVKRFLLRLSDMDFRVSFKDYAPAVLGRKPATSVKLDVLEPVLRKTVECGLARIGKNFRLVAELAFHFEGGSCSCIADRLLRFSHGLGDSEARLRAGHALVDVFLQRSLWRHAVSAAELVLSELSRCDPWVFHGQVSTVLRACVGQAVNALSMSSLVELLEVIRTYDYRGSLCSRDRAKAEALAMVTCSLRRRPANRQVSDFLANIASSISCLEESLMKDYVRVQIVGVAVRQNPHSTCVGQYNMIEDHLCQLWATALMVGEGIDESTPLASQSTRKTPKTVSAGNQLSANTLLDLGKQISDLAAQLSSKRQCENEIHRDDAARDYMDLAALAIADIAEYVVLAPGLYRANADKLANMLMTAIQTETTRGPDWGQQCDETLSRLLTVVQQINWREARHNLLSEIVTHTLRLEPIECWRFLPKLCDALEHTRESQLLGQVLLHLPDFLDDFFDFSELMDLLNAKAKVLSGNQAIQILTSIAGRLSESEGLRQRRGADRLVRAIAKVPDKELARRLIRQLGETCIEDTFSSSFLYEYHTAVAECFAQLGLWQEGRRFGEDQRNAHGVSVLMHLGFCLDLQHSRRDATQLYVTALNNHLTAHARRPWAAVYASIALGWARLGEFLMALKILQRVKDSEIVADTLIKISREKPHVPPSPDQLEIERSLLEESLSGIVGDRNILTGLAAYAKFLRNAGRQKDAGQVIQKALAVVKRAVEEPDHEPAAELLTASSPVCELVIESGNEEMLRDWVNACAASWTLLQSRVMLDITAASLPAIRGNAQSWLMSRLFDLLPSGNAGHEDVSVLHEVASALSHVRDQRLSITLWKQFINRLSQMQLMVIGPINTHLFHCLLESNVGKEQTRLIRELTEALVHTLPSQVLTCSQFGDVRGALDAVLDSNNVDNKLAATEALLGVLPTTVEDPWMPSVMAARCMALVGEVDRAVSCCRSGNKILLGVLSGSARMLEETRIALEMAEVGLIEFARPLLLRYSGSISYSGDDLNRNVALGLLRCGDYEAAKVLGISLRHEEHKVELAAELFAHRSQSLVKDHTEGSSLAGGTFNYEPAACRQSILGDMRQYLGIVVEGGRNMFVREDGLARIADAICRLPKEEAAQWLIELPGFRRKHEAWISLCRTHHCDKGLLGIILDAEQHDCRRAFMQSLSALDIANMPERLRYLLCIAAVDDADCFFKVLCNTLENCRDAETLEKVKAEIDEIEDRPSEARPDEDIRQKAKGPVYKYCSHEAEGEMVESELGSYVKSLQMVSHRLLFARRTGGSIEIKWGQDEIPLNWQQRVFLFSLLKVRGKSRTYGQLENDVWNELTERQERTRSIYNLRYATYKALKSIDRNLAERLGGASGGAYSFDFSALKYCVAWVLGRKAGRRPGTG